MAAKIINASFVGSSYQYVVSSSVGELFIVSMRQSIILS